MKLLYSPNSPYARKCRVILREKKIDCIETSIGHPLQNPPELIAANPLGKVPALVLNDGDVLCDSTVITEYLDSLSDVPRLIPARGKERFAVLGLAALADGIMDMAVECYLQSLRAKEQQWPDWIARRKEAMVRAISAMEGLSLLEGPLQLAQINVATALAYVEFRHADVTWRGQCPQLEAFLNRMAARPSMHETAPRA